MHTLIRDRDITTPDFVFYSDRVIHLVNFACLSILSNLNGCSVSVSYIQFIVGTISTLITQKECQVVEHGLGHLPFTEKQVVTPTGTLSISTRIAALLFGTCSIQLFNLIKHSRTI